MRILLVEDDAMLGRAIRDELSASFALDWFQTAADATSALDTVTYDLVILDLSLPDGSGLDIVAAMRSRADLTPVLILTARDAVRYRIEGLNAGADDYLVKPFDMDELTARCRALMRRSQGLVSATVTCGDLVYNSGTRAVTYRGQPVALSGRELMVLECLVRHRGTIVSKSQIEDALYDLQSEVASNTVEVHISALRAKTDRSLIRTVRGIGYELVTGR